MGQLVRGLGIKKYYRVSLGFFTLRRRAYVRAVDGVDISVGELETHGLVGESGSGKSTLGRLLAAIEEPTEGRVVFDGTDLRDYVRRWRTKIQVIFQNPDSSLNPKLKVKETLIEALQAGGSEGSELEVEELLEDVGLNRRLKDCYPHQLSGGQRQRVAIARALAVRPKFIVADEIVSALDATVKAQILNLMLKLQRVYGFSMLFISHDLPITAYVSDVISVMYLGKIVESAPSKELLEEPLHPYTVHLISSVPSLYITTLGNGSSNVGKVRLRGEIPSPINIPRGCRLHPRCPLAREVCRGEEPPEIKVGNGHVVYCHLYS